MTGKPEGGVTAPRCHIQGKRITGRSNSFQGSIHIGCVGQNVASPIAVTLPVELTGGGRLTVIEFSHRERYYRFLWAPSQRGPLPLCLQPQK